MKKVLLVLLSGFHAHCFSNPFEKQMSATRYAQILAPWCSASLTHTCAALRAVAMPVKKFVRATSPKMSRATTPDSVIANLFQEQQEEPASVVISMVSNQDDVRDCASPVLPTSPKPSSSSPTEGVMQCCKSPDLTPPSPQTTTSAQDLLVLREDSVDDMHTISLGVRSTSEEFFFGEILSPVTSPKGSGSPYKSSNSAGAEQRGLQLRDKVSSFGSNGSYPELIEILERVEQMKRERRNS